MSIEAYMMRTPMVKKSVDHLHPCMQSSRLIRKKIVHVIAMLEAYVQKHSVEVHWVQHVVDGGVGQHNTVN